MPTFNILLRLFCFYVYLCTIEYKDKGMERIRMAEWADCPVVYSLICEMEERRLSFADFQKIYNAQIENEMYACLVYERQDKVIGCINLRMENQLHHDGKICEIMELSVGKEYQNQKIGQRLFFEACHIAQSAGCLQIEVCCNQLRQRTHHFYEKQGMHNFHYKFSLDFSVKGNYENRLGR